MSRPLSERFRALFQPFRQVASAVRDACSWWFDGARQIGSQIRDGFFLLGQALKFIVLLPVTIVMGVLSLFGGLRKTGDLVERSASNLRKSVRGSVVDLQDTIEAQPRVLRSRSRRILSSLSNWFRLRPRWQKFVIQGCALLAVIGALSAYPAWNWLRTWRAEHLLGQAQELVSEGRELEAFFKGQAAYYIDPGSPEVLANLVELARGVRHPNTLAYGRQLLEQGTDSVEVMVTLAEEARDQRQLALARAYLGQLERLSPNHPDLPRLRIQFALASKDEETALRLAEAESEKPGVDRRVFEMYASLALNSNDISVRNRAEKKLSEFASDETMRGLVACVALLQQGIGSAAMDERALTERILANPVSGRDERLFAWHIQLKYRFVTYAEIEEQVRREFSLDDKNQRFLFARWLFQNELFAELTKTFPLESDLDDRPLLTLHLLSLLYSGREKDALEILRSSDSVIIPELDRLVLEGRALRELGQEDAFVSTIERAIARAGEGQFFEAERLLKQLGDQRFLIELYEKYSRIPSTSALCNGYLMLFAYRDGNEETLSKVASRSRIEGFRDIPTAQSLLAYYNGLADLNVSASIREIERLVADYPSVIDFRVALAVNYYRAGFVTESADVLEDTGMVALSRIPGMYAVSLAILKSTNRLPEGLPPPSPPENLLPIERSFVERVSHLSLRGASTSNGA